ncbi:hypothetical protein B0T14DRAFT_226580 [Immersiella caudata]|uniref:Uncharacterized protein n=1 Tax=Immersiella caudata TaxID=314043 RepID=A0AA39WRI5_9PEZI|nr:hypothetical protein B0T14DRAFT_226580 [Immersiella caudata]
MAPRCLFRVLVIMCHPISLPTRRNWVILMALLELLFRYATNRCSPLRCRKWRTDWLGRSNFAASRSIGDPASTAREPGRVERTAGFGQSQDAKSGVSQMPVVPAFGSRLGAQMGRQFIGARFDDGC